MLVYEVSSQVGGKLAQVGQRLIDAAAKSLAEDFFKRFEAALAERLGTQAASQQAGSDASQAPSGSPSVWTTIPRWAWFLVAAAAAAAVIFSTPPSV